MKDVKKTGMVKKRELQTEYYQSALTDHVAVCNQTIDWEGVKIPVKDSDWNKSSIRETICIRKAESHVINHDEGHYHLPDVYSKLLQSAA